MAHDLVIGGATILDGSGGAPFTGTVCVDGDRIVAVLPGTERPPAAETVDAAGLALAPGFVDVHTHDDIALLEDPAMPAKVSQGVTTVITGLCGYSPAPFLPTAKLPAEFEILMFRPEHRFERFGAYLDAVKSARPVVNTVALVGHSTLRLSVMDDVGRPATADEIAAMGGLLDAALAEGAIGLSSGLAYAMARKAETSELIALSERMRGTGGFYVTHLRDEAAGLLDAVDEALEIGRASGAPVIFSHHKSVGRANHGGVRHSLARIDAARQDQKVGLDVYPYDYSSTALTAERAASAGGEQVTITRSGPMPEMAGRKLSEVAAELGCTEAEAVERLMPGGALYHTMAEADVRTVLAHDLAMIGSDGLPFDARPHPRLWGTFPRVLGHYARDEGLFPLQEAVRRMTGLPAETFGLKDRGFVRAGCFADLVLFDPAAIRAGSSLDRPKEPAAGIERVFVNGAPAAPGAGRQLFPAGPRRE